MGQPNALTSAEIKMIEGLRDRGHAVVTFNPRELRDAEPHFVEDQLIQVGWDVIDGLATYQQDE